MNTIRNTMAVAAAGALLCAGQAMAQAAPETQSGATGSAPVAGRTNLGVAVIEMDAVISGWSVKNNLLRKAVVNEKNEKIGAVDDIIITPSADAKLSAASFAIVGVGGFLGIKRHDVVIPMEQLKLQDGRLVLQGATKESLKALPPFEYRRK
jgi:sporulation protein YlmC with PRC-barrel domain